MEVIVSRRHGLPDPFKVFLFCGYAWSTLLLVYFFSIIFYDSGFRSADIALILIFVLVCALSIFYVCFILFLALARENYVFTLSL